MELSKPKKKKKKSKRLPKELYNEVAERDNYTCQLCGWGGEAIHLHHISYGSSRVHDNKNLIVLCYRCHDLVHSNKRKYKPILEDIIKGKYND